jgi:hypothetical protein
MFKVSPASLQTFIDTPNCVLEDRVRYSTVHILNVFCDGHLQIISFVEIVQTHLSFYCNHQMHRDFLITLYKRNSCTILWANNSPTLTPPPAWTQNVLVTQSTDMRNYSLLSRWNAEFRNLVWGKIWGCCMDDLHEVLQQALPQRAAPVDCNVTLYCYTQQTGVHR